MGPARHDPQRQVGIFNPDLLATFPALRKTELEKFRWIMGEWRSENHVPATRLNPAYIDVNPGKYAYSEDGNWVCLVRPNGRLVPHITFDPFSRQWMYVLADGAYGILRSAGWNGNQIVFTGQMMMIGVDCELRQTWNRIGDDEFNFVNEEKLPDGNWGYIDEWRCRRKE